MNPKTRRVASEIANFVTIVAEGAFLGAVGGILVSTAPRQEIPREIREYYSDVGRLEAELKRAGLFVFKSSSYERETEAPGKITVKGQINSIIVLPAG